MESQMMSDTEPDASETELETPIKFRWTGKARRKITGRNLDFDSEKSDRVVRTLDRQKTNVVVRTLEEAESLADEMNRYADAAGSEGRVWVNGAIASACERVQSEVSAGMRDRGFVVDAAGLSVEYSEPADDLMMVADVVDRAREIIHEHGAVEVANAGMSWVVDDTEDVQDGGDFVRVAGGAFSPGEHTEVSPAGGDH